MVAVPGWLFDLLLALGIIGGLSVLATMLCLGLLGRAWWELGQEDRQQRKRLRPDVQKWPRSEAP